MIKAELQTEQIERADKVLSDNLNGFASQQSETGRTELQTLDSTDKPLVTEDQKYSEEICEAARKLFDSFERREFSPKDFEIEIPVDSLESYVGYSSLIRQMHRSFVRRVAFYRSKEGGSLSVEEARKNAFHVCTDKEEAIKIFDSLVSQNLENLNFADLLELFSYAPRVAEEFWEVAKQEGRKEFESGHLAANIAFPADYMKELWNIARYMGVRESFIEDWQPKGGIEVAMIDMLAQSWFQWQFWLEQTTKRSQTQPRREHHAYQEWKKWQIEKQKASSSWSEGYWFPPYVHEQQAIEHAVQMADRFNRIFMRTLRQLRDLRRYSPVIIQNTGGQVNVGNQQVNVKS